MMFACVAARTTLAVSIIIIATAPSLIAGRTLMQPRQRHRIRQGATVAITGLGNGRSDNGSVPYRLEIRDLEQNADQWNLYLLALYMMQQSTSQTDELSYYQIAGIHGRPFIPWDGVSATPGDSGGYCTHTIALFPTWHRPYLALFEVGSIYDSRIMADTAISKRCTMSCRMSSTCSPPVQQGIDTQQQLPIFAFLTGIGQLLLHLERAYCLPP